MKEKLILMFMGLLAVLLFAFLAYAATPMKYEPALAYDPINNRYLFVYTNVDSLGEYDIHGQLINPDGTPFGLEFVISNATDIQDDPLVAYDSLNRRFLVAWTDYRNFGTTNQDVYGQLVNADGSLYNTASDVNFAIANVTNTQYNPSVAFDSINQRFLVVWEDFRIEADIYGQLINADGSLYGNNFVIADATQQQSSPSVAFDNVYKRFLVASTDNRKNGDNDVYGQLINADGSLYNTSSDVNFAICDIEGSQGGPSVAYDSANKRFLVAWTDNRNIGTTGDDIYGQLINAGGSLLGANFVISNAGESQSYPSVTFDSISHKYLVAWEDYRDLGTSRSNIYGQLVNADGSLFNTTSDVNFVISNAVNYEYHPSIAFNSNCRNFLSAFYTEPPTPTGVYDINLALVGTSCPTSYTGVTLLSPNGGETIPSGSTYPIHWEAPLGAEKFDLLYSLDNGLTWTQIANKISGTGYFWTVPKPWGNKKKCLIKVIGYNGSNVKLGADKSDTPFSIEVVRVTSPGEGEILMAANLYPIHWTTNTTKKPVAKVKLYYTKDGGTTWDKITREDGNPESYDWQVPCVKKDKASCRVKVILLDADGNIVGEDESNGYFTIVRTCIDISGNWDGTDKITVTCEYDGQSESGTFTGSAIIYINQNNCKINWTVPGTNEKRSGTIWCDKFGVSGKFCNPEMLPGAIFSTNQLTASGTVNGDMINLTGWGQCSGTYQGVSFTCYGKDKTVLTRSLYGITDEKQTAKEPKLFMNNSLRIFSTISP